MPDAYFAYFELAELAAFVAVLAACAYADVKRRVIPNACIVAALAIRALFLACAIAFGKIALADVAYYLASACAVIAVLMAVMLVADLLAGRDSLGGGDVKLLGVAALYLGWERMLFVVLLSCVFGLLCAAVLKNRDFPFAPAIALACTVVLIA